MDKGGTLRKPHRTMRMARNLAVILLIAGLAACANRATPPPWTGPMDKQFIRDETPLDPPDSRDLQKLVLTLPIFEVRNDELKKYLSHNTSLVHTEREWSIFGDGAQDSIRVVRLSAPEDYNRRIKVIRSPGSSLELPRLITQVSTIHVPHHAPQRITARSGGDAGDS